MRLPRRGPPPLRAAGLAQACARRPPGAAVVGGLLDTIGQGCRCGEPQIEPSRARTLRASELPPSGSPSSGCALVSLTRLVYIAPAGIPAPAATERWLSG